MRFIYVLFVFALFINISAGCGKDKKPKSEVKIRDGIIIDSDMTFDEAVKGTKAPKEIVDKLKLLNVRYFGFDSKIHEGQIVVHQDVEEDVKFIFDKMLEEKFPVQKVIPIVKYNWSDDASMSDNNTSAFNYRNVAGTNRLSNHSLGKAIDINPFQNPAVYNNGRISPRGAKYSAKNKGTILDTSSITIELKKRGWRWGGDWSSLKDYQHFDKVDE